MSKDTKIIITLKDNGLHSLYKGIESFEAFNNKKDKLLLKDAIMFLHHGIELLMKEILAGHSQFLIFEDLRDCSKKQKKADDQGVGIFFIDSPPKTVTYEEAINRVDAFIKPAELNEHLRANLTKLNRLRNQLEHYAIDADIEDITKLLAEVHEPLIALFESQIGGVKNNQPPEIVRAWEKAQDTAKFYSRAEEEVFDLVKLFRGQNVSGHLFNLDGNITLPNFDRVLANPILSPYNGEKYRLDLVGLTDKEKWIIEVKGMLKERAILDQLIALGHTLKAKVWLVSFSTVSPLFLADAKKSGILVSGRDEIEELRKIL